MEGRVARIAIAPVKALHVVEKDEVELAFTGVAGDRRFWMVDADGRLVNDKRHPQLLRLRAEWDEATRELGLEFPDGRLVAGVVELGEPVEAEMYGQPHASRAVVGPWQEALSEYAGEPVTFLWSERGAVDRGVGGGAVTVISRASLARLGREAGVAAAVDGRRFRMLFEIDGVPPHAEDEWLDTQVRIGDATIQLNGDVGRCVVTSHDPDRGITDFDTLGTLARYRREGRDEDLPFGVYGTVAVPGRVRVGDPVERVIAEVLY